MWAPFCAGNPQEFPFGIISPAIAASCDLWDIALPGPDPLYAGSRRHPGMTNSALRNRYMSTFDKREEGFEKKFALDEETKFKAEAYILTKEEGGRHTPFFTNYRPQFYFRTTDVTGIVTLPAGTEMVMPGDNISFDVELITPVAMEEKLRFAIREGGRTVGAGVVASIQD